MARTPMIPLDPTKTVRYPPFNGGPAEVWYAESADHLFRFERIEEPGTPWVTTHVDFPNWSMMSTSLAKARRYCQVQLHLDLTMLLSRSDVACPGCGIRGLLGKRGFARCQTMNCDVSSYETSTRPTPGVS